MGAGSQIGFEKSGASFDTIEAIAFTQLRPDHSADLPAYIGAAQSDTREQRLTIMGPTGDGGINPATRELIERLFGPEGAYPHLADAFKPRSSLGYRVRSIDVPASGSKRWARYQTEHVKMTAIPVHHGDIPALAWRIEIDPTDEFAMFIFYCQPSIPAIFQRDLAILFLRYSTGKGCGQ